MDGVTPMTTSVNFSHTLLFWCLGQLFKKYCRGKSSHAVVGLNINLDLCCTSSPPSPPWFISVNRERKTPVLYLNLHFQFLCIFFSLSWSLQDLSNKDMKRDLYIISQVIRTGETVVTKMYSMTSGRGRTKNQQHLHKVIKKCWVHEWFWVLLLD